MDSIIVYRNPLEKQFYESNGPAITFVFALVMGVTFLVTYKLLIVACKIPSYRVPSWIIWTAGVVSVVVGFLVIWLFVL